MSVQGRHASRDTTIFPMAPPFPSNINIFSQLVFWYMNPLFWIGYKRPLQHEDVWELPPEETLANLYPILSKAYEQVSHESWSEKLSFWIVIHRAYSQLGLYTASIPYFFKVIMDFCNVLLFYGLMKFVTAAQDGEQSNSYIGYLYAFGMFLATAISSICAHQHYRLIVLVALRMQNTLQHLVFRKTMCLSTFARQQRKTGEIVNLMSVDASRAGNLVSNIREVWNSPMVIIVGMIINSYYFGWSTLAGLGAMVLISPLMALLTRQLTEVEKAINKIKDERIKLMNEVLHSIRVIKYFAWENRFEKLVSDVRQTEYTKLRRAAVTKSIQQLVSTAIAMISSAVTFIVYFAVNGELEASNIFSGIAVFSIMTEPFMRLPDIVNSAVNSYTSINRIGEFMQSEELVQRPHEHITESPIDRPKISLNAINETILDENDQTQLLHESQLDQTNQINYDPLQEGYVDEEQKGLTLVFRDASFSYLPEKPALHDINLTVAKGQFVAIVGRVGSGKSSLLNAIFGEAQQDQGYLSVHGNISYCSEKPWVINATIRDNIIFGCEFDEERYNTVLDVCQLGPDLKRTPMGDMTEIGENGVNLSPGQQHRLSLARAAYCPYSSIVLLDSTLNAVDNVVQANIIRKCLIEFMKQREKRTILLVTHSLHALKCADTVLVMEDGRIVKNTTDWTEIRDQWENIEKQDKPESSDQEIQLNEHIPKIDKASITEDNQMPEQDVTANNQAAGKIVEKEDRESGSIGMKVIRIYFSGYGIPLLLACLVSALLAKLCQQAQTVWLGQWSNAEKASSHYYMSIYASLGAISLVCVLIKSLLFALGNLRSANSMHTMMLQRILQARMYFFDSNPIGRILNRFTSDQFTVDYQLIFTFNMLYTEVLNAIGVVVIVSYITPMFLSLVIPLGVLYYFIQEFYRATSREMRRLESTSKSPLLSHIAACIRGVSTIRAYSCQQLVFTQNEISADYNGKHFILRWNLNRWLGVRVEFMGALIVFGSAVFAMIKRRDLDPSLIGLSVSFALQITNNFLAIIRQMVEFESNLTSCERIMYYGTEISTEPNIINSSNENQSTVQIPEDWPQTGSICFKNVTASYRPDIDPPVLKNINLDIAPGERIGIVGRTGAGKSTMLLCLFRFLECAEGKILIDDLDISQVPLKELRKRLTIIPQSPALFSGTIRSNIDVFDEFDDAEIWRVLNRVHMSDKIERMSLGLMEPVTEHGSNLSIGEQALLSLSRSLLHKNRIIIFDEATAYVDHESDKLIQETIRAEFKDCTTITIAHRLDTVIDNDRVVVLDRGEIIEQGIPYQLLNNHKSRFYNLVSENGEEYVQHLRELLKNKL